MVTVEAGIAGLAFFVAAISLALQLFDVRGRYVRPSVDCLGTHNGCVLLATSLDNVVSHAKKITGVFLLINPVDESPVDAFNGLRSGEPVWSTQEFADKVPKAEVRDNARQRILLPLPYYTEENVSIGDERLTYTAPVDVSDLSTGFYSARMYVYGKRRLHRVVQTLIVHTDNPATKETSAGKRG